jgi:hypothetical protein
LLWTVALVVTGILGLWLVPKRPMAGWFVYLVNEVLWGAYALHTNDHALFIMAWIWGGVGLRNLILSKRLTI